MSVIQPATNATTLQEVHGDQIAESALKKQQMQPGKLCTKPKTKGKKSFAGELRKKKKQITAFWLDQYSIMIHNYSPAA